MSGLNFQPTLILSANCGPNLNILGICVLEYWCGADLVHEVANFITSANIKSFPLFRLAGRTHANEKALFWVDNIFFRPVGIKKGISTILRKLFFKTKTCHPVPHYCACAAQQWLFPPQLSHFSLADRL